MSVMSGEGVFSRACIGAGDLAESTALHDAALTSLGVKNMVVFELNDCPKYLSAGE